MYQWMTQLPRPLVHEGVTYHVQVLGIERDDGTWEGRLLFRPGDAAPIETGQETSQPDRDAVEYWATGLEPVFLEGALQRALDRSRRRSA